ncbi:cobalt-zinc-cadmium efflux system outer membrane protein [Luteibacter rhizovicinus]|uniref:Cobalt-zinc-cadmium efflux system outer membrane protein n=1 Tax=Luteibacter rhizovicinus TaxID=242606 RepID=A0A4R3YNB4_9GAMM|nr:TolC family protein [Luteibacter rhizovicinus]TCV93811.1 cobalt-zinc-cadmium efflux system outer membrane protein [Luteibacter rhizovicinus]
MYAKRTVPIGAVCLLFAALANATPPAAPAELRDAVRRVWAASPELDVARANRDAARARADAAAQPLYNPTLSLDAENADVNRRTAGLSLALDVSGKRAARTRAGQAAFASSDLSYALTQRDLATRWLSAWTTTALATRRSEMGRHRVDLMRRFDALAVKRLAVGDIASPERDLAGLALGEAEIQQATLTADEAAAQASLSAIAATSDIPAIPTALPPASDSVMNTAIDALPESLLARGREAEADAAVDVARRARIPDPTIGFTGGRVRAGAINDRVIGLSLSIPLPVLNTGRADVDASRADSAAASANTRASAMQLGARQRETRARYAALRTAAEAFRRGRAGAYDERAALLEKLWSAGEIGTSDYLVQLKQSLDTALAGIELESRLWQAWFDYLAAAGRLNEWIDGSGKDTP